MAYVSSTHDDKHIKSICYLPTHETTHEKIEMPILLGFTYVWIVGWCYITYKHATHQIH